MGDQLFVPADFAVPAGSRLGTCGWNRSGYIATDPNLHQGMQAAEIIVAMAQVGPDVPPAFASTLRDRCLVGREGYRVRTRVALSMRSPRSWTLASR